MNHHLYDKLQADHRQELQNEVARHRLLMRSSVSIFFIASSKIGGTHTYVPAHYEGPDQRP